MPQHLEALAIANEVRAVRRDVKRRVATGETTVPEVLADPPAELANMPIHDLLIAQRNWGEDRTGRLLKSVGVSPLRTVGQLTVRQCQVIGYRLSMGPGDWVVAEWVAERNRAA
jgi:hypothetical protein